VAVQPSYSALAWRLCPGRDCRARPGSLGVELVHGGRPDVSADENAPPKSLPAGRHSCRCGGLRLVFTRGSPGLVLVRGGLDCLAAGRPGPDPRPRLDSRPVQAELPARTDPLNPPIVAARVDPSHPGFRWLWWLWWRGHGPNLLPVKDRSLSSYLAAGPPVGAACCDAVTLTRI